MKNFKLTLLTAAVRFLAIFPLKVHYFGQMSSHGCSAASSAIGGTS